MAVSEISIAGIRISTDVVARVVAEGAEATEGVVRVGGNDIASSLVKVFTTRTVPVESAVEAEVDDEGLKIAVHLAVFYGYPFVELAQKVRDNVAKAILEHIGVDVAAVDVCIDSLVFPKEM